MIVTNLAIFLKFWSNSGCQKSHKTLLILAVPTNYFLAIANKNKRLG
jgi:hypothetical protein